MLDLLSSMSETQRVELESSTLYQTSAILREVKALKMTQQFQAEEPIVMELNKIPEKDIGKHSHFIFVRSACSGMAMLRCHINCPHYYYSNNLIQRLHKQA